MNEEINIQTLLRRIKELKSDPLLPNNWASIIASQVNKTDVIVREWSLGKKNVPDGPLLVLKCMNEIISERKKEIRQLIA